MTQQSAKKLRLGLIGAGSHMKETLFPVLRMFPQVSIESICSQSGRTAEEFANAWNIPHTTNDYMSCLDLELDALICSGPVALHEQVATLCLERRLPLFVEKPLCRDLATLISLEEIQKRTGSILQIGYNLPFALGVERLHELITEQPHEIEISYHTNKPTEPLWDLESLAQSFHLAIAVHPLMLASNLLKNSISKIHSEEISDGTAYSLHVHLESSEGNKVVVRTSNAGTRFDLDLVARTPTSQYKLSNLTELTRTNDHKLIWRQSPLKVDQASNGFVRQMKHFLSSIGSDPTRSTSVSDSRWMYELFATLCHKNGSN